MRQPPPLLPSLLDPEMQAYLSTPQSEPVLLTSTYNEKQINLLFQAALLSEIMICIIVKDPDPHNLTETLSVKIAPHNLRRIWQDKSRTVKCSFKLYNDEIREEDVGYHGLMVDKLVADAYLEWVSKSSADASGIKYKINPLSNAQFKKRKGEIESRSLEMRAPLLEQRGYEIYKELRAKYPGVKFTKAYVAKLICREECPIYELLDEGVPKETAYLKHLRKPE